jgi:glycosyltransferase involved in cell wall biosynthesis
MHVIVLAIAVSSQRGGIEKSTLDLCQGLHQRQHTITLIYQQAGDQLAAYREFCRHTYALPSYRPGWEGLGQFAQALLAIRRLCATDRSADQGVVVYSSEYHTLRFGGLLAMALGAPLVYHLRLPVSDYRKGAKMSPLLRLKNRLTLAPVKTFIAVSQATKQDCIDSLGIHPGRIDVVYNGIDPQRFSPAAAPNSGAEPPERSPLPFTIAYVGRLDKDKGLEVLLRAFAQLRSPHPEAQLLIAGQSLLHGEAYRQQLAALAESLGIGDRVQFLGHVAQPLALYQRSDLTVLPSLWPEPFGRTIIESLAAGTPVVASRTGGIPEILAEILPDCLVEPGQVNELAEAIGRMTHWRQQRPHLGQLCRQHVLQHFTLEQTLAGVERVLLDALAQGKPRCPGWLRPHRLATRLGQRTD